MCRLNLPSWVVKSTLNFISNHIESSIRYRILLYMFTWYATVAGICSHFLEDGCSLHRETEDIWWSLEKTGSGMSYW